MKLKQNLEHPFSKVLAFIDTILLRIAFFTLFSLISQGVSQSGIEQRGNSGMAATQDSKLIEELNNNFKISVTSYESAIKAYRVKDYASSVGLYTQVLDSFYGILEQCSEISLCYKIPIEEILLYIRVGTMALATLHYTDGNSIEIEPLFNRMIEVHWEHNDPLLAWLVKGLYHFRLAEFSEASNAFWQVQEIESSPDHFGLYSDPLLHAIALNNLEVIETTYGREGDYLRGITFRKIHQMTLNSTNKVIEAAILANAASYSITWGEYRTALDALDRASALSSEFGNYKRYTNLQYAIDSLVAVTVDNTSIPNNTQEREWAKMRWIAKAATLLYHDTLPNEKGLMKEERQLSLNLLQDPSKFPFEDTSEQTSTFATSQSLVYEELSLDYRLIDVSYTSDDSTQEILGQWSLSQEFIYDSLESLACNPQIILQRGGVVYSSDSCGPVMGRINDPQELSPRYSLLKSHAQIGSYDVALEGFDELLNKLNYFHATLENQKYYYPANTDSKGDAVAETLVQIGKIHLLLGNHNVAKDYFSQALKEAISSNTKARANYYMGLYHQSHNEFALSMEQYLTALNLAEDAQNLLIQAKILTQLGEVHTQLGNYDQASGYINSSVIISEEFNSDLDSHVIWNMGEEIESYEVSAGNLVTFASLEVKQNNITEARAIEIFESAELEQAIIGNFLGRAEIWEQIGNLYGIQGNYSKAIESYKVATILYEHLRGKQLKYQTKTLINQKSAPIYEKLINLMLEHRGEEALFIAEQSKSRTFLDQLVNQDVSYRDSKGFIKKTTYSSYSAGLSEDHEIRLKYLPYTEPVLNLELLRNYLTSDQALITYYATTSNIFAFVITERDFRAHRLDVSLEKVKALLKSFEDSFKHLDKIATVQETLQELYNALLAPLLVNLNAAEILISPHGDLHNIPFTALWDGIGYWGEVYDISLLPSASILRILYRKKRGNPNAQTLLSLSNPVVEGYPYLTHAKNEAEYITELFEGNLLLGAQETRIEKLQDVITGKDIIHIASHGILDQENPANSRLVLGENLNIQEIYNLDLSSANLVTLSACRSSLGRLDAGDEIASLSRAFIYAGTPSVIATLWTVNDQSTEILMTEFFKNFKSGMNYAEALQTAQAHLRTEHPEYAHPFFWAPFVLTGDIGD